MDFLLRSKTVLKLIVFINLKLEYAFCNFVELLEILTQCLSGGLYALFVACETADKVFISTECSVFPIIGSTL